jgi:hypothetical protein
MADFPDETAAEAPSLGKVRWIFDVPEGGDHTEIETQIWYDKVFSDHTRRKELGNQQVLTILTGPEKLAIKNALQAPWIRLSSRFS